MFFSPVRASLTLCIIPDMVDESRCEFHGECVLLWRVCRRCSGVFLMDGRCGMWIEVRGRGFGGVLVVEKEQVVNTRCAGYPAVN